MKNVLITGGPTNEYIDEVMKITNMSSGRLATELATHFLGDFYDVTVAPSFFIFAIVAGLTFANAASSLLFISRSMSSLKSFL